MDTITPHLEFVNEWSEYSDGRLHPRDGSHWCQSHLKIAIKHKLFETVLIKKKKIYAYLVPSVRFCRSVRDAFPWLPRTWSCLSGIEPNNVTDEPIEFQWTTLFESDLSSSTDMTKSLNYPSNGRCRSASDGQWS